MKLKLMITILFTAGSLLAGVDERRPVMTDNGTNYWTTEGTVSTTKLSIVTYNGTSLTTGGVAIANTRYLWVSSSGLKAPPSKSATFVDRGDFGAWEFADGADEQIVGNIMVPTEWDGVDNMLLCVGWESTTTNANCVFEVEWLYTAVNDDVTASGYTCLSTNTSSATAQGLVQSEVCYLTNSSVGDVCVHLRVMRDGNSAGDTLGADAYLHGIALKYTKDKP